MLIISLKSMAELMEKPVQEVLENAKEANAVKLKPDDRDVYIDVEAYQNYMDREINEGLKSINCR